MQWFWLIEEWFALTSLIRQACHSETINFQPGYGCYIPFTCPCVKELYKPTQLYVKVKGSHVYCSIYAEGIFANEPAERRREAVGPSYMVQYGFIVGLGFIL